MLSKLVSDPKVIQWFNQAPKAWFTFLQDWQDREVKRLRLSKETLELFQCQGRLEVLDRIVTLPAELAEIVGGMGDPGKL